MGSGQCQNHADGAYGHVRVHGTCVLGRATGGLAAGGKVQVPLPLCGGPHTL